jgi:DNA-binding MarR family transcriptional regulator
MASFIRMKHVPAIGLNPTLWRTCKMLAGRKRIQLLRALCERPGQCVKDLGEAVGIKRSDASQELRRIQSRGLLKAKRQGLPLIYRLEPDPQVSSAAPLLKSLQAAMRAYPPSRDADIVQMAMGLANERRLTIVKTLRAQHGSIGELQRRLGYSRSALHQHLQVLVQSGFIAKRQGVYRFRSPAHPVGRVLIRLLRQT